MGSAYASFEENIKVSLDEGNMADMVILSEDIFKIEHDRINEPEVEMTFLGGNIVCQK